MKNYSSMIYLKYYISVLKWYSIIVISVWTHIVISNILNK